MKDKASVGSPEAPTTLELMKMTPLEVAFGQNRPKIFATFGSPYKAEYVMKGLKEVGDVFGDGWTAKEQV